MWREKRSESAVLPEKQKDPSTRRETQAESCRSVIKGSDINNFNSPIVKTERNELQRPSNSNLNISNVSSFQSQRKLKDYKTSKKKNEKEKPTKLVFDDLKKQFRTNFRNEPHQKIDHSLSMFNLSLPKSLNLLELQIKRKLDFIQDTPPLYNLHCLNVTFSIYSFI
jgi:hypothetical protein